MRTRTRLAPAERREQLLDLGVALLSGRRLEEVSIDLLAEEAGVSRGLLYHYFASKRDFHLAVLARMADQVYAFTAPVAGVPPREALSRSLEAYVGFVAANRDAYLSFVRTAAAGDEDYRRIHEEARAALTGRIFDAADEDALAELGLADLPAVRLVVRGWSAMVEDVVLEWLADDRGVTRTELLVMLAEALFSMGNAAQSIVSATR